MRAVRPAPHPRDLTPRPGPRATVSEPGECSGHVPAGDGRKAASKLAHVTQRRHEELKPIETHDTATILVGTALWVIALLALVLVVEPADPRPVWTCVAGIGLGLFGLCYVRIRDARRKRRSTGA